jgi:outer membrane receptor for ferrienterochelin and colicins
MKIFVKFLLLSTLVSVTAQAQVKDSSKTSVLEEVVVTGQYQPQSVKRSVYQVRIISKERIQKASSNKIAGCSKYGIEHTL